MPREYMPCWGKQNVADDDTDCGYSRFENANDEAESAAMVRDRRLTEDDYFRPPDSYQWSAADNDQGQEQNVVDQGSGNYSAVHVQSKKDKKKLAKKTLVKRIRHFLRVSFKWIRRGLVTVSPAVAPTFTMNPAMLMTSHSSASTGKHKSMVFL